MKVIILFALASVCVCTDPPEECSTSEPYVRTFDWCDNFVNEYAKDKNCMKHALESKPQLMEIAKKLICKHRRNELDNRFVFYAEFEEELMDFKGCTGCFPGEEISVEDLLGNIGAALGTILGIATKLMGELIHSTGTFEMVLDFICGLLTGKLASDSVDSLSKAQKETLDVPLTVKMLRSAGILGEKYRGLEDELENVPAEVVQTLSSTLKSLLNKILNVPVVDDLVKDATCLAGGLLGGLLGDGTKTG